MNLLLLLVFGLSAQTYRQGAAYLLATGQTSVTTVDQFGRGTSNTVLPVPAGSIRLRFWYAWGFRPVVESVTDCSNPCSVTIDRTHGKVWMFYEGVDGTGNPYSPRRLGHILLPHLPEPASSTLRLPVRVTCIGCEVGYTFSPLAGTSLTGLRLYVRADNITTPAKAKFRMNGGTWTYFTNTNTPQIDSWAVWGGIGTYAGVLAEFAGVITNLQAGANTIWFGNDGGPERSLGWRLKDWSPIEGNVTITQIVATGASNTVTATTASTHGYATGDWVQITNARGMKRRFDGARQITGTPTATSFTFVATPDVGASFVPAGTYAVPTQRWPVGHDVGFPSEGYPQPVTVAARRLIAPTSFVWDDPATSPDYTAPSTAPADISAGQVIWQTRSNQTASAYDGFSLPVACGDCHTWTGADMQYFNYSNREFYAAAYRTGKNYNEARQLISYIRSMARQPGAWPWSPVFQPGPGQSGVSAFAWPAGAGEDAVLNYDLDQAEYLLAAGTANWRYNQRLETRNIPVPYKVFGWNKWLTGVHPRQMDATFFSSQRWTKYQEARTTLAPKTCAALISCNHLTGIDQCAFPYYANVDGIPGYPDGTAVFQNPRYVQSLDFQKLWGVLKLFEVMTEFEVWDCYDESLVARHGATALPLGTRGAYASNIAFQVGDHKAIKDRNYSVMQLGGTYSHNWDSHIWYFITTVIGLRAPFAAGDDPSDFPYGYAFHGAHPDGKFANSIQNLYYGILNLQAGAGLDSIGDYQALRGDWFLNFLGSSKYQHMTDAEIGQWLGRWMEYSVLPFVENRFTQSQWSAKLVGDQTAFMSTCTSPTPANGESGGNFQRVCDSWAYGLPVLKYFGVNQGLIDRMVAWLATHWPGYNWAARAAVTYTPQTITVPGRPKWPKP